MKIEKLEDKFVSEQTPLFVFDYRYHLDNFDNAPIRVVMPTEVRMISYKALAPLNKNGTISSKRISVYDTTNSPNKVQIYDNMNECLHEFQKSMQEHIRKLEQWKSQKLKRYDYLMIDANTIISSFKIVC